MTWRENWRNSSFHPKQKYLADNFDIEQNTEVIVRYSFFFLVRRLLVPELFRLMYRSFCNTFSTYYFILPIITIALCGTRIRIRKYTTANNKRKLLWRPPNGYDFGTTRNCANERAICLFAIFSSAVMLMCARWPASRLPGYARLSIMTSTISYNLALRVSTTFAAA